MKWLPKGKIARRLLSVAAILLVAMVLSLILAQRSILNTASRVFPPQDAPKRRIALVLGCSPTLRDGRENWFFRNRTDTAAELYRKGGAEVFLLSGDNSKKDYDEPTAMKTALIARGVPENRIVLDYAGFSTLDSVVRAKKVFGVNSMAIVSQRDHVMRALYIADAFGIEAVGVEAKPVGFRAGIRTSIRESLARVRTVLDLSVFGRKPKFLGPKIEIATVSPEYDR